MSDSLTTPEKVTRWLSDLRAYVIDGVPTSGIHQPLRQTIHEIEEALKVTIPMNGTVRRSEIIGQIEKHFLINEHKENT